MKILLVNTYKNKDKIHVLQKFLSNFVDEMSIGDFSSDWNRFDSIIISGSERLISDIEYPEPWFDFLRDVNKPVLGICYGMQLLSLAYGGVAEIGNMISGDRRIRILENKEILKNLPQELYLPENHREKIIGVSKYLEILAVSDDGIEAVKIHNKFMYGTQFHFERSEKYGPTIIKNFLSIASNQQIID